MYSTTVKTTTMIRSVCKQSKQEEKETACTYI